MKLNIISFRILFLSIFTLGFSLVSTCKSTTFSTSPQPTTKNNQQDTPVKDENNKSDLDQVPKIDGKKNEEKLIKPTLAEVVDLCANSEIYTYNKTINFPKPKKTCDWEKNGNGKKQDRKIRARYKENKILNIPKDSILCEMNFSFQNQNMFYDDEIFLLYNDIILMASTNYANLKRYPNSLKKDNEGFIKYEWENLIDQIYAPGESDLYCLGLDEVGNTCEVPPTETQGTVKLTFSNKLIQKLATKFAEINFNSQDISTIENKFSFVTIGDNDNSDCIHSDFIFDVNLKYIKR